MLSGDLATTPLADALVQLAHGAATGCLHVVDPVGEEARVYLRGGFVYAVLVPGRRAQLGARLVSAGTLAPEALADALEAQRTELQGWRLGELLVHLGYVDQAVVEAFVQEQLLAATCDLTAWTAGAWRFRPNERTRDDVAPPVDVPTLLAAVAHRTASWASMSAVVDGPDAVPVLSASGGGAAERVVGADAWSMLCKVDGTRSVAELAREGGFTLYEAVQTVYELVCAGLVEVEGPAAVEAPAASFVPAALASRLAAALAPDVDPLAQVSAALSAALGTGPAGHDAFQVPAARTPLDAEEHVAPVVDLDAARREAEEARRQAERAEAEQVRAEAERRAQRLAAEEQARAQAEAERAEVERREVERAQAEAERAQAQRREAERVAAEEHARAEAEAARREAERVAAEEHARAEAEAARLEAERVAAEEHARAEAGAARREAERVAAEEHARAQAEAARLEAERAEAERLHAERVEAGRLAAEQHARAHAEAARLAQEQARMASAELAAFDAPSSIDPADAALAFAELRATAASESAPEPEPVAVAQAAPLPPWEQAEPAAAPDTDTAALLRELSSLGFDDDPVPAPARAAAPATRPVPVGAAKKRKGLFGRG